MPPPEVLLPLGAGVAVVVVALIVLLLVRRARRRRATSDAPGHTTEAVEPTADPWDRPTERIGSGRTVAAAVAQALAAREAQARTDAPWTDAARTDAARTDAARTDATRTDATRTDAARTDATRTDAAPQGAAATTGGRGDARDRLLAVLLDDPVRAVGAVVELEACRRQLDRLTDAVRHERATLAEVLGRLSAAGLASDQLVRLSGLSDDELRLLMLGSADAG